MYKDTISPSGKEYKMTFFKNIFGKSNKPSAADPSLKAKNISKLIEKKVNEIFFKHHLLFIDKDNDFIVFSVWGARMDGELTPFQKETGSDITLFINNIIKHLGLDSKNEELKFAIGYLIRDMLISKLVYMTEFLRTRLDKEKSIPNSGMENLNFGFGDRKKPGESDGYWNLFNQGPEGPSRRW
jgi:hypothetical protein